MSQVKKYDLGQLIPEAVTALSLNADGMLYVGSADAKVYSIEPAQSKLLCVYEGHWSRIDLLYMVPNEDILVAVSESNCKVWDLTHDEAIFNMDAHSAPIVFCKLLHSRCAVCTVSRCGEYIVWNYDTG